MRTDVVHEPSKRSADRDAGDESGSVAGVFAPVFAALLVIGSATAFVGWLAERADDVGETDSMVRVECRDAPGTFVPSEDVVRIEGSPETGLELVTRSQGILAFPGSERCRVER